MVQNCVTCAAVGEDALNRHTRGHVGLKVVHDLRAQRHELDVGERVAQRAHVHLGVTTTAAASATRSTPTARLGLAGRCPAARRLMAPPIRELVQHVGDPLGRRLVRGVKLLEAAEKILEDVSSRSHVA